MATDVTALITAAQEYTATLVGDATTAMDDATNRVTGLGWLQPASADALLPAAPPSEIPLELPNLSDITLEFPTEPGVAPNFQDIAALDIGMAPTFDEKAPSVDLPSNPSHLAEFVQAAPTINTAIVFPEPPDALIHPQFAAPELSLYTAPEKPQIMLPSFSAAVPEDTTEAPTNLDVTLERTYTNISPDMMAKINGYVDAMVSKFNPGYAVRLAAIESQINRYLQGGTGLNPSVENAIYERARSKNNAESLRVRDAALTEAASRGFTMPTGTLLSAMQLSRQAGADANARAASEIVVMQAEMEQKNLQFAVTTSASLHTALLNSTISYMQNLITVNGQALDYAKSVLNAIVETYNVAVKAFTVKLEAYKAEAHVYEVKIRGAMAGIELYTAEVKALELLVTVDRSKVDLYRARIETLTSLANVYRSQIEAVQGRVGLEKLKLEVFQSQVQAYASRVQAKNSEWQGYAAAISGQEAKARIYGTQVQAFTAKVGGYSATISAKSEAVRATAVTNQARADQYKATLAGYQTIVSARGEKARTEIAVQGQLLQAFQAKVTAAVGSAQVAQGYYKATADVAISNAVNDLKGKIAMTNSLSSFGQTVAQLGTANAQIYGNLASSAMAGMNTLVSQSAA